MSKLLATLALAGTVLVTGCATPPTADPAAAPGTAVNAAGAATTEAPLIGSRLAKRNTDRAVRSIDNQTFKQDTEIRGRGNDLGMQGN
ncbi:MAG: hypothetical protein Q8K45_00860 [Rubrivivax sp.]|nr:hypothetical protein [Rubrivivax sp.]